MPGLLGIVEVAPSLDLKSTFERMLATMQRGGRLLTETGIAPDHQWALGRVHLGTLQPARHLAMNESLQVLFHGELLNEAEVRKELEPEVPFQHTGSAPSLLRTLYRFYGVGFASRLRGSFCAVVLDEKLKRVVVVNDYLGSYPLYWFSGTKRFVFASELKAILRDSAINFGLDPRAIADYLTFGFLFGNKTLVPGVQLLPPSSTLTYSWEDRKWKIESYTSIKATFGSWEGTGSEYMEEIRHSFNRAVKRSLSGDHKYLVSLSGGLDSRAILSAIDCKQKPIATYTLGVKGCADEVIAKKLSGVAAAPNRFLEMGSGYVMNGSENIRSMVRLTDGMYLTHGLTEMLALRFIEETDFSVLLRGHGGELAKASLAWPLHTDERIYQMQRKEELISYLLERVNYVSRGVPLQELFTDEWWLQIKGKARQSLEESIADVSLSPPDLCSYLYLTEHHRRFTISSLELFRNYVEVRMPFVDEEFLRVLFRSPPQWREKTDIHRTIIGRNSPALLRVRNSNTGAPGDAGPHAEKLWDKVNSLCKRLNIYGYRHYHNFERWMKQKLLESVEQVLLHPRSLARGMLKEAGLRRLIGETKQGVADHAYLLQVLLILELWQQENEGVGGSG
jgi:asparagine synthase (glutamine-hydrolysing)